jgi:hypothetical protein
MEIILSFFQIIWQVFVEVAVEIGTDPAVVAVVAGLIVSRATAMLARIALPPGIGEVVAQVVQLGIPKLANKFAAVLKARQAKKQEAKALSAASKAVEEKKSDSLSYIKPVAPSKAEMGAMFGTTKKK